MVENGGISTGFVMRVAKDVDNVDGGHGWLDGVSTRSWRCIHKPSTRGWKIFKCSLSRVCHGNVSLAQVKRRQQAGKRIPARMWLARVVYLFSCGL